MTTREFLDQKEYLEIDAETARDLAYGKYSGDLYKRISNQYAGEWRWGNEYALVIEDIAGNFWRAYWRNSSCEGEWRTFDDGVPIVFTRVVPREKVVVEYVEAA